jgi:uncharacterized protein (TIGR02996 family)
MEKGFLRAILEAPEDTTCRLVYADWLEEHNQPERAEFIRIECEMAAIHDEPGFGPNTWESPRFWELEKRREELYNRHAARWFGLVHRMFGKNMDTRRGFPWHVSMSARRFITHGEDIFQAAPTIEDVMILRLGRNMPELARCPALRHVRRLEFFETPFRTPEAVQFAGSPHLANLRALDLGFTDTQVGPAGATALARARTLTGLEDLNLFNHAVYDEGAEVLFRSRRLATLTALNLGNNGLTDETALALYEVSALKLRCLELMSNHLTGRGVGALADAAHLAGLERLSLHNNPIGSSGGWRLVQAHFASRLHYLGVYRCDLDDGALAVLFGGSFPNLEEVHAAANTLGQEAARALVANKSLARLRTLSVSRCGIGTETAAMLAQASLQGLRSLHADGNSLGPAGVRALLAGPLVAPIDHLVLNETDLGDEGAFALASSSTVTKLRWLVLDKNHITDRGAVALAESPYLADVQALELGDNEIGPKGKKALNRRFGDRVRY